MEHRRWGVLVGLAAALCVAGGALGQGAAGEPASARFRDVQLPGVPVPASEFADAESVFEKYIEAIGGRETVFGITSRQFVGRVEFVIAMPDGTRQRQSGRVDTYAKAPNLYVQDVIFPGLRSDRTVFDGEMAWRESDTGEVVVITGEELERVKSSASFYQAADYEKQFASYEVIGGSEEPSGERYVHVLVEYASGRQELMLFDEETGLLRAIVTDRDIGNGERIPLLRWYDSYKSFDGVSYPTTVKEQYANVALEYSLSDVVTGIEMPAMRRPAAVREAAGG
ncbi:MAG: hypothetical protein ACTS22_01475 [Phycisphaerales bacterium]